MSKHFDYIRQLSCVICGNNIQTEVCHVRFADRRAGKAPAGIGIKSEDCFVVPMCGAHHRLQHSMGERQFWNGTKIDPVFVALALWASTGDHATGSKICAYWSSLKPPMDSEHARA